MSELEISDQNFDLSFLLEIADGSSEFIIESIELFLHQTPELIATIDSAIEAKEWSVAATSSHKLKPNLGFFGMLTSQTLMQELEVLLRKGEDDPLIKTKFSQVAAIVKPTLDKLAYIKKVKEAEL
jgi:HPt (histidine-containing phosphotransfer) domain-containing protein